MIEQLLAVALTALFSSLFTLILGYLVFRWKLKALILAELNELSTVFRDRVKAGLDESGRELLPQFREQVREGFKDAMSEALTGGLVEKAVQDGLKKSTNIMESGLKFFLGKDNPEK